MTEDINHLRRRLVSAAALSVAATQFGVLGAAQAQSGNQAPSRLLAISPGTNTSFAPLKQVDAGVLNVGYAEAGPAEARRSSFCTAGPTTSIPMWMWRRCSPRRAIG